MQAQNFQSASHLPATPANSSRSLAESTDRRMPLPGWLSVSIPSACSSPHRLLSKGTTFRRTRTGFYGVNRGCCARPRLPFPRHSSSTCVIAIANSAQGFCRSRSTKAISAPPDPLNWLAYSHALLAQYTPLARESHIPAATGTPVPNATAALKVLALDRAHHGADHYDAVLGTGRSTLLLADANEHPTSVDSRWSG